MSSSTAACSRCRLQALDNTSSPPQWRDVMVIWDPDAGYGWAFRTERDAPFTFDHLKEGIDVIEAVSGNFDSAPMRIIENTSGRQLWPTLNG